MRTNHARQFLKMAKLMTPHRNQAVDIAFREIAGSGPGSEQIRDRLYLMFTLLPSQIEDQARQVLGDAQYANYKTEIAHLVAHFRSQSMKQKWEQVAAVLDRPVVIALTAIADLVDARLALRPVDESKRSGIEESIRSLIDEIKKDDELDESIREYLLGIALHLLQAVQNFVVFGADAVVDLQGQFVTDAIYEHPELVDERSRAKRYATKLWTIFIGAATLVGAGPDAAALVTLVRELTDGSD